MRILEHPILGTLAVQKEIPFFFDGQILKALPGETIASALWANEYFAFRRTPRYGAPRGVFCAIGKCSDCMVNVDGEPNVKACNTLVREGMHIQSNLMVEERENE
jgi:predicted molibdopterin-dependent oxidoreductase YjgC